jgi:hypothetical protein
MHLRHLSTGFGLAICLFAQAPAATVYKWTDSNGVVHYSDQSVPGAERIITQSGANARPSAPAPVTSARTVRSRPGKSEPTSSPLDYTEFEIDSPQPDQTFSESSVSVRVRLEPGLKPGHLISLYLNGKLVENQSPQSTQFSLNDLPRGAYTLVASLMDASSGESKSTPPVSFNVRQNSLLSPLRKKKL